MTGISDENGVRYATYTYDTSGRAMSTEHAGGVDKYYVQQNGYDFPAANGIPVIGPLNSIRNHHYQIVLDVVKHSGEDQSVGSGSPQASTTISYDANGNISSRKDFNGNQTTYVYDMTRNLEVRRVEAVGTPQERTTNTSWHPQYRLPVSISEPGRSTAFTYDASGNLLTKTVTDGMVSRSWQYTYNNSGQVLTMTGPRTDVADVTRYDYDSVTGNLLSITNAAQQITSFSNYDGRGNARHIVDPNGLATDLVYHPRGWLLSRTVGGETTGYEYDNAGQLKKVTLPDHSSINYTYDPAHRLTDITDSLGNTIHYVLDPMGNRTSEQVKDPGGILTRLTTREFDALNRLQSVTGGRQ